MNDNNITVFAKPMQAEDEIELDLLDLLAALMLKWKVIIAVLLVGALLGFGYARMKNHKSVSVTTATEEEATAAAREKLSEDKAFAVEQLFFQYVNYLELQKEMRLYYGNLVASDVSVDNTVQMRTEYYITSGIRGLDTTFIKLAVTEADYQAMRELAPDEEAGAAIYNRVLFTTAYNEKADSTVTNSTINIPIQDGEENAYLIHVELYGNSEEQCREMMTVVDEAFRREAEDLKLLDKDIKLEKMGEQFNNNVADYVQNLHKQNIDKMTIAENELNNLAIKVGKFSADEKNYYNLLQQQFDETYSNEGGGRVSTKKWTVIGAFLGAVMAVGIIFLVYVFNGKVKSPCELESSGRLLNRVYPKGKKNLFGRWAAALIHADETDALVKADMVATDISILTEKNGKSYVMLLCSEEDKDAAAFAGQVKTRLEAKRSELKVSIGNPVNTVEELEVAAQADMGVAIAEMGKSKRAMLREWRQICERYKLPLAGSVAVRRCW